MTQFYIGIKQIEARPRKQGVAAGAQEGYAVRYPDGYESWSPKVAFEDAYIPQGADATRVTEQMVDDFIVGYDTMRMGNHTVVKAVLRNGFTVVRDSACVDPANYHEGVGTALAMQKIKAAVWEYLGFVLAWARNGVDAELHGADTGPLAVVQELGECDQ